MASSSSSVRKGTDREKEHGEDLWPESFQGLPLQGQIHIATQLARQSSYLQKMPFIHTASNIDNVIDRLNKSDEEFSWALSFDPQFIATLASKGFLPMAGQCFADLICLLPKLHKQRCVLTSPREIKVSRNTRKRSKKYVLTVDEAFDEVVSAIQIQHGENCWFYAPLTNAYKEIHAHNNDDTFHGVRIHSIELWEPQGTDDNGKTISRRLVAGELGYAVGGTYTSLSGFRHADANGAGTLQCCVVAKLLSHCGFSMWDLGMGMDYKYSLGGKDVSRANFIELYQKYQKDGAGCLLKLSGEVPAKNAIEMNFDVINM